MLPRSRITIGIDAGKCQHQAAVYDLAGDRVVRRLRVPVSRAGFEHLRTVLAHLAPDPSQVRVGLEAALLTDPAGLDTFASCARAHTHFGVRQAVVITQRYHLPRAVYTCRQLGIEATGLGTPDWERYSSALMVRYTLREWLATLNALLELHATRPRPELGRARAS